MDRTHKLRIAAGTVCFLLLFALLFAGATQLLRNKNSAGAVLSLYEEPKDSLDVIFLGSSHILNGVFPMELWEEYGIVSNNFGQHGQTIPVTYYMAEEAIRTQHPKWLVLDGYMLFYADLIYDGDGNTHKSIDNMAWAAPKLRAIFDLFDGAKRWDYLVPLSLFHSRWKEVSAADLQPPDTVGKGCEYRLAVQSYRPEPAPGPDYQAQLPEYSREYFDRLAKLCEEEGVELVLMCAPFRADTEQQGNMASIADLAEEYGLTYWNYLERPEVGFDPETDLFDHSHLNANGALKLTRAVGADLAALGVPDRRGETEYAAWDDAYTAWRAKLETDAAQADFPLTVDGSGDGLVQ